MNKQTEALKMAIKFIEAYIEQTEVYEPDASYVLMNCLQALEHPAQEPVLIQYFDEDDETWENTEQKYVEHYKDIGYEIRYLYTHPAPSWQGLSVYDILSIDGLDCVDENDLISFARAIEQAHGIK